MQGTDWKLETLCEGKMQPAAAGVAVPVDSGEGYKSKTCSAFAPVLSAL